MSIRLITELIAAAAGCIAFALLFHVPRRYYLMCGAMGICSWLSYSLASMYFSNSISIFLGTIVVVLLARIAGAYMNCPVTIFLIVGIFPLVPGAGIYWTAYYIVMNELQMASQQGMVTFKAAVAIAFGILVVFELPQKWFLKFHVKKNMS